MKNKLILLLIICAIFNTLAGAETLHSLGKFFTKTEQKKLIGLTRDYDRYILSQYDQGNGSFQEAYSRFFSAVSGASTIAEFEKIIHIPTPFKEKMLKKAGKKTLCKIWNFKPANSLTIASIKLEGSYLSWLKEINNSHPLIKEYIESIMVAGDIGPFGYGLIRQRAIELDVNDTGMRLILAVHYISLR
jgi:hypothetical protein